MPRHRVWGDTIVSLALVDNVPQQIDLNSAGPVGDTLTVVRLIGRLTAYPNDQQAQVTGAMKIDVVIGVASQTAFDLGITGTPNIQAVAEVPPRGWMYRSQMITMKDHATGTTNEHTHVDGLAFDVKAARKLDRGRIFIKVESATSNGGTTFDVRLAGVVRALFLT